MPKRKIDSFPGLSGPATPAGDGHYLALVEFACALIMGSSIQCYPLGLALLGALTLDLQHQQLAIDQQLSGVKRFVTGVKHLVPRRTPIRSEFKLNVNPWAASNLLGTGNVQASTRWCCCQ